MFHDLKRLIPTTFGSGQFFPDSRKVIPGLYLWPLLVLRTRHKPCQKSPRSALMHSPRTFLEVNCIFDYVLNCSTVRGQYDSACLFCLFLSVRLSLSLCLSLFFCLLPARLPACLSVCLVVCLSLSLSLSVSVAIYLSVYSSVYAHLYLLSLIPESSPVFHVPRHYYVKRIRTGALSVIVIVTWQENFYKKVSTVIVSHAHWETEAKETN